MSTRKVVAVGPVQNAPSWRWVGEDTARALSKFYDVRIFADDVPDCDVALIVKKKPKGRIRGKIIYCPIDAYSSVAEIASDSLLPLCSAVLIHSERLRPYLKMAKKVWYIDHHNRYGLDTPASYRETGNILWIGAFQYLPYIVKWLGRRKPPLPVVLLTDLNCPPARVAANGNARRIGVSLKFGNDDTVNGFKMFQWSEELQKTMLATAKAAIDIKGDDFNQRTKPATKAQNYVASGIPFAANLDSYSAEYLNQQGLNVCSPDNYERWFSRDYWVETALCGERLRKQLSLDVIAAKFRDYIEML